MNHLVYLDVETTGLDPAVHQVWEIAWAVDDGPIRSAVVPHSLAFADPVALAVSGHEDRCGCRARTVPEVEEFEEQLRDVLEGATVVGANPAFDTAFLAQRWGARPWHFRLLDVEAFAMGVLAHGRLRGLAAISEELRGLGFEIPAPDHTAGRDVAALRACFLALRDLSRVGRLMAHPKVVAKTARMVGPALKRAGGGGDGV